MHNSICSRYIMYSSVQISFLFLHDVVFAFFVCLSVSQSHVGVLSKRLNVGSQKKTPYNGPGTLIYSSRRSLPNLNTVIPHGGAKQMCGRLKSAIFNQYLFVSQKRCKIGTYLIWMANKNMQVSVVWCYFQWPWVTLTTPNHPNFHTWYCLSYLPNGHITWRNGEYVMVDDVYAIK